MHPLQHCQCVLRHIAPPARPRARRRTTHQFVYTPGFTPTRTTYACFFALWRPFSCSVQESADGWMGEVLVLVLVLVVGGRRQVATGGLGRTGSR